MYAYFIAWLKKVHFVILEVKQHEAHDLWSGKFSILIYTMYECERD